MENELGSMFPKCFVTIGERVHVRAWCSLVIMVSFGGEVLRPQAETPCFVYAHTRVAKSNLRVQLAHEIDPRVSFCLRIFRYIDEGQFKIFLHPSGNAETLGSQVTPSDTQVYHCCVEGKTFKTPAAELNYTKKHPGRADPWKLSSSGLSSRSNQSMGETKLTTTCLSRLEEGDTIELGVATHTCNIPSDGIRLEDTALSRERRAGIESRC